jgi:hypothetical protein
MDGDNRMIMSKYIYVLLLCLFAVFSCSQDSKTDTDCAIHSGPCSYMVKGTEVILDITPKPVTTMTELEFTVHIRPDMTEPPRKLLLDLAMPRMEMGENKIVLQKKAPGVYSGKGIIVDCPSGRKDWKATVWVPGTGEAHYLFKVK